MIFQFSINSPEFTRLFNIWTEKIINVNFCKIAIDLKKNNLYVSLTHEFIIFFKVKTEKVIRLPDEDKPRGIDVDSCEMKIYFTNWNPKSPSIQRAWFSGYGLEPIITTKIRMPNAIAIDALGLDSVF